MGNARPTAPSVAVWDSRKGSRNQIFEAFRHAVCTAFMPWTPERGDPDRDFEGRVESVSFGEASVGLCRTKGLVARKTAMNIARSPVESLYANYVISGEISLAQAGERSVARAGDLLLYHSHKPVFFAEKAGETNVNLAFSIPFASFADSQSSLRNAMTRKVDARDVPAPLIGCFHALAGGMLEAPAEERSALFAACVALLPLAVGSRAPNSLQDRWTRDELLKLIHEHLHDSRLSAGWIAGKAGVSTRKLQRLFANHGTTFSAYVAERRLDAIRMDLMNAPGRQPISEIAYRWGFADLSTFNRAFRKRFGSAPSGLRG